MRLSARLLSQETAMAIQVSDQPPCVPNWAFKVTCGGTVTLDFLDRGRVC